MSDYDCPICGKEFVDSDYFEIEPEEEYEVECDQCGTRFYVSYFLEPVFVVGRYTKCEEDKEVMN